MEKTFDKSIIPEIADECLAAIFNGESVTGVADILKRRGSKSPVQDWYEIRRWIKSNWPDKYANIPLQMRREISDTPEKVKIQDKFGEHTVKLYGNNENQETQTPEEQGDTTSELPGFEQFAPKKRGRKPGTKIKKPEPKEAPKEKEPRKMKMMILTVGSEHFIFRNQTGKVEITMSGNNSMIVPKEHVEELIVALAQAVEMFKEGNNGRPE